MLRYVLTRNRTLLLPITAGGYFSGSFLNDGGFAVSYVSREITGILVSGLQDEAQAALPMTHVAEWLAGDGVVLDLNSWWPAYPGTQGADSDRKTTEGTEDDPS